jgi:DNA-binding LacI/PurR family transcriptional regulator
MRSISSTVSEGVMTDLLRVATLAGVSRDTAARAFSAPPLLNPDTLHKGLAASA